MVNKIEDIVCANSRQFCLRRGKRFFFYLYTDIILSVHVHTRKHFIIMTTHLSRPRPY